MTSTIVHPGRRGAAKRTTFGYTTEAHPRLDRLQNGISAACGAVAGLAAVLIAVLTLLGLAARNLFSAPMGWSVGFTEMYLLPIVAFFGAVTAYRSGAHIAVVTLFNRFPTIVRKGLIVVSHLIVFLGFVAMAWGGIGATVLAVEINQGPIPGSALLLVPGWVMESIVPVACVLGATVVGIDIYREIVADWATISTDYEPGDTEADEYLYELQAGDTEDPLQSPSSPIDDRHEDKK